MTREQKIDEAVRRSKLSRRRFRWLARDQRMERRPKRRLFKTIRAEFRCIVHEQAA